MKYIIAFASMLLFAYCASKPDVDMTGAYSLNTQVLNDGSKDSALFQHAQDVRRRQRCVSLDRRRSFRSSHGDGRLAVRLLKCLDEHFGDLQ